MDARKRGTGFRYDLPENGSHSGSSGSSASSYLSFQDGVHGRSRMKADAERRKPPLWALAFLAFFHIFMFPLWSKPSHHSVPTSPEQGLGNEHSDREDPGPEQREAPASTEAHPTRRKSTSINSPFKHSASVHKLLAWVEKATYTEGARPDWRDAVKQSVAENSGFPNLLNVIPDGDKLETLLCIRGKQVRVTAHLFNINEGWDGSAVARDLEEPLLNGLDEAVADDFLGQLRTRTVSLKAGNGDTGVVLVTLTAKLSVLCLVTAVSPSFTSNDEAQSVEESAEDRDSASSTVTK